MTNKTQNQSNQTIDITPLNNLPIVNDHEGQPEQIQPPTAPAIFSDNDQRFFSSIPQTDRKTAALLVKALSNPTAKLDEVAKTHILYVKHIVAHDVTISTETGDQEGVRVVMVMEDNSTVSGVSAGLKSSIANIMRVVGNPPWTPSLPLFVAPVKTRRGFNTYNLLIADEEDTKLQPFGKLP